jgi:hypothetical protein
MGDGSGKEDSIDDEECKLISLDNFNGFRLLNDREKNNNKTLACASSFTMVNASNKASSSNVAPNPIT